MNRLLAVGGLLALGAWLALAGLAQADDQKNKDSDHDFMKKAAMGGLKEIRFGSLAAELGASDRVRQFGRRMVEDHTAADKELQALAKSKGVELPSKMEKADASELDKLSKMKGAEFDRKYMKDMVKDHEEDVELFEKMAKDAKDPDLRQFAAKTLPTVRKHLEMARDITGERSGDRERANTERRERRAKD